MKFEITIHTENKTETIYINDNKNLHSALAENGYVIFSPCGGNGKCQKCKILASGDFLPPYGILSDIQEVFACKAYPAGSCSVYLNVNSTSEDESSYVVSKTEKLGIAFDIGTTSISASLCSLDRQKELQTITCKNAQSVFGADIISRISCDYKKLSSVLTEQINSLITKLCSDTSAISKLTFSANTVMSHYIAGLSPEGLSAFPFTPADSFGKTYPAKSLGINCENATAYIFPSLAPFVGGDISSGLFSLGAHKSRETSLFIDIGTNGELALLKDGNLYVTSAAAGPAFEGAELSCGMPAEPGAVISFDGTSFRTIGDLAPRGIAGSGAIDILAKLSSLGVIDKGGRLLPPDEAPTLSERLRLSGGEVIFSISENVYLSASDIRKLQLAKAAIRAAVSLLLQKSDTSFSDISNVYIAGAFGASVNPESTAQIGLIPKELLPLCIPVGNSSLKGAHLSLFSEKSEVELLQLREKVIHIELSGDPEFEKEFLNYIPM